MHIISKKKLRETWQRHPEAEGPLRAWHAKAKNADWGTPGDIKRQFSHASFVQDNRVVFNIGGNKFRLITWINYPARRIYVKWAGTHAEYDRVDVNEVGL